MSKIWILLVVSGLSGCAVRSVYVPSNHNITLFDDKKQVQATANAGFSTIQLQLAHNPIPHFEFGLNTLYGSDIGVYEGCIGYYNYRKNKKWRYELLGGGGYTNNFLNIEKALMPLVKKTDLDFEASAVYYKAYLQPALGYFFNLRMYKLNCSISTSWRFSYLDFKKYVYREIKGTDPVNFFVNKEYANKNMFIAEPCFTNKVGRKNLYGVFQAMLIIPYSKQIDTRFTRFSPRFLLSLGIQYNLVFKKAKADQ